MNFFPNVELSVVRWWDFRSSFYCSNFAFLISSNGKNLR